MIEKLLLPFGFSFGQLQDISTLLKHLEKNNVSIKDFIEYIAELKIKEAENREHNKKIAKKHKEQWQKIALKCPECNTTMNLYPVNTHTGDQTGDGSKSMWQCPKCWYDEYSTKSIREQFEEIRS